MRPELHHVSADSGTSGLSIEAEGIHHFYLDRGKRNSFVHAVNDVSIDIPAGQFVSLVGPSGCGKTTLLNNFAGLVKPTAGRIVIRGEPVTEPRNDFGYVFARGSLLPWKSARQNVEFAMKEAGFPKEERRDVSEDWLRRVGLWEFRDHYPYQLSQGMRQRVGIARTMACRPQLILLDEPFAALDAQTRVILQEEFLRLWSELNATAILITHDLAEAVALSDRVILMTQRPGRIKLDVEVPLDRPRDLERATFRPEFREVYDRLATSLSEELERL